jgi:hypothetical protein
MQKELFPDFGNDEKNKFAVGNGLTLTLKEGYPLTAILHRNREFLKEANLNDKLEKKLFIIEAVTLGAMKLRLASALGISRQTIDNYIDIKEHFGHEGLVRGYSLSDSKSLQAQRKKNAERTEQVQTNIIEQLTQKRREAREAKESREQELPFNFGYNENAKTATVKDQPYSEEHDWEKTRYAGTFIYLITLISKWKWLQLVMGYFGDKYHIFMIFILMAARNIRSIEQLKNLRSREAGIVLGIKKIPIKPKVWERFYSAAEMRISSSLIFDFFRYQIYTGLVGIWLWFTDGHLLPYTGKEKVHYSYNTQRRMPVPGQTNMVTCDADGRIVDFDIQEGKGDLRGYVVELAQKWDKDIPGGSVMVFDREGSGVGYFSRLVRENIAFVTWKKNVDTKKLLELDDELFTNNLEFNGKKYSFFEEEKSFIYKPEEGSVEEEHSFTLRRIYIWNKTSKRRTCGLSWTGEKTMSTEDCAQAILSRWGASENTFKHINERHPLHYHPGFKMVESEKQDIANPAVKEKSSLISRAKTKLNKLYKQLADAKTATNKDGSVRQNSVKERLKENIVKQKENIDTLQEEKRSLPERVDVSLLGDYKSFKQVDNEGKNLFDFVTSSVWNARKQMVDWLRPLFNCENELIDLFYAITYCHGWIKSTKSAVVVRLEPMEQPKRRAAQEQLCRKLTALGALLPTGKYLIVEVGESPI